MKGCHSGHGKGKVNKRELSSQLEDSVGAYILQLHSFAAWCDQVKHLLKSVQDITVLDTTGKHLTSFIEAQVVFEIYPK